MKDIWIVMANHSSLDYIDETPWIVHEGTRDACLLYVTNRGGSAENGYIGEDYDRYGNDVELEAWPKWKYEKYYR